MKEWLLGVSIPSTFALMWGTWGDALNALFVLMVFDFISGIIAASAEGRLSSLVGSLGIAKKLMILLVISLAHHLDTILGTGNIVRDGAVIFYAINEMISIIENCGRAGVPLPDQLMNAVELLKDKESNKEKTNKGEEKYGD